MNGSQGQRIGGGTRFLMVGVALFVDVVQIGLDFIPVAGWFLSLVLDIITWLGFYIWFKAHDIGIVERMIGSRTSAAKRATAVVSGIIEAIFSFYPGWTVMIIVTTGTLGKKTSSTIGIQGPKRVEILQEKLRMQRAVRTRGRAVPRLNRQRDADGAPSRITRAELHEIRRTNARKERLREAV